MRSAIIELTNSNQAIERAIDNLEFQGRGASSQDLVSHLRHLLEHIAMFIVHGDKYIKGNYYDAIYPALQKMKQRKETRFLWQYHYLLQKVISHYTPSEDNAERILLQHYEYLILLKEYMERTYGITLISNLNSFPIDIDPGLSAYYTSIACKIERFMEAFSPAIGYERFYVHSVKSFFANNHVYYESTLIPAYDVSSKFDHILTFSSFRIPKNYSINISTKKTSINGFEHDIPVIIVDDYRISIRPCEINSLLKIFEHGITSYANGQLKSYRSLMSFLTSSGMTLYDIVSLPEDNFKTVIDQIEQSGIDCPIHTLLNKARSFLKTNKPGCNIIKYLLSNPRNRVIKDQLDCQPNNSLGGLYLKYGCIPFEKQPYCTNLIKHEISATTLYSCIDPDQYEDDHLARFIAQEAQINGILYVSESSARHFSNIDALIEKHNSKLYCKHTARKIKHSMKQLFTQGDEANVIAVLKKFLTLSENGFPNYKNICDSWLYNNRKKIDDPAKELALKEMFMDTKVAFIYGSAGTGKTTMVDIICNAMNHTSKLAIANTNPAVDSLRRKITDTNCDFMTIAKYLSNPKPYDILIVDECSTVSNQDICTIVQQNEYKLLLLIGDERQIESIKLGNWFSIAKEFLPDKCIHEFNQPWRATNEDLPKLWDAVRTLSSDITEILVSCQMTSNLNEDIFHSNSNDEIVLCLNYDGLYGINNVNKMLQIANPRHPYDWNLHIYKVGDPILFNESNRFYPLLYNNLKGRIVAITMISSEIISFEVAVNTVLSRNQARGYDGLEYIKSTEDETYLRFSVHKDENPDNEELDNRCIVPFQVAYAISIHKAQGLDYSSVKIVITKDVEKRITHNIFYTAITRARETLHIYWSPESQREIISHFTIRDSNRDAQLISKRSELKLHP